MGLFGSKKTYVSSTVYNLAGDEANRPDFLKHLVVGQSIAPTDNSMTDTITSGYLNGPGVKMRNFYNWADSSGYNTAIGLTSEGLGGTYNLNLVTLAANIDRPAGTQVMIQRGQISPADFEFWAEQYLCDHEPATLNTAWSCDYSDSTGQVTITRADASTVTFTPDNFGKTGLYVLAAYNLATTGAISALVMGSTNTGPTFPSTTGWSVYSSSSIHHTELGGWDETHVVYTKTQYMGDDGTGRLYSRTSYMHQDQLAHDDGAGLAVYDRSWRTDTQDTTVTAWSTPKVFIYRIGWGNTALDAMVGPVTADNSYFAPIPVRLNNVFVSETHLSTEYDWAKKAYSKLTGGKFDKLVASLADNPHLGDIDYVFAMAGVSLNVQENACRQYIYNFLHHCMTTTAVSEADYELWQAHQADADTTAATWQAWFAAQSTPGDPLYGTAEPPRYTFTDRPKNEVRVATDGNVNVGFDMRIYWQLITETTGTGLAKPGAKTGEVWFVKGDVATYSSSIWGGALGNTETADAVETCTLFWQIDQTSWKKLTIKGLKHFNFVYKGKAVEITAFDALDDTEESGFIFPLHQGIWREMSLVTTTQMATASVFIVINCYKVVKQKWYQTGIFKIIVFIAIVVISIYFPPAGATLGSVVGGAAGLTGMSLAIATAVVNALASMIIMQLVSQMVIAVFGQKLGSIIMAVLSVAVVLTGGTFNFSNIASRMGQLMQAQNILALTESVGQGYAGYLQGEAMDVMAENASLMDQYKTESKKVTDLYAQNVGYDTAAFDPTALLGVSGSANHPFVLETPEAFLTRTLMTGSDVAQMSLDLLTNFAELTLNTDLPI